MSLIDLAETSVTLAGGWIPGRTQADYFPLGGDHVDQHQLEMLEALERGDGILLNTNATGAGKTLSWAAPVIRSRNETVPQIVLATYPTTALIEDQRSTLLDLFRRYHETQEEPWASERTFDIVTSEGMDDPDKSGPVLVDGQRTFSLEKRVQTISATENPQMNTDQQLLQAQENALEAQDAGLPTIILTTPDTLTNLSTNRFHNNDVHRVVPSLDAIIVDEFHLATDRARRLLPFHLDVHRILAGRYLDTFVFLSATPEPGYIERIDRAFDHTRVTDDIRDRPGEGESSRQILPETRLGITSRPQFTNGEWLADNVTVLERAHEPRGQLLVIVDSVREVEAIFEALENETTLSAARIYGWKKEGRKAAIEDSQVVVGNTAVEVGVDFQNVNRVVLTGYEANSTLQRIGRMRHRSKFDDYRALLITRPNVQSGILDHSSKGILPRQDFDHVLHSAIDLRTERPYYDVLCGAYSRFLWDDSSQSLDADFVNRASEFQDIAYDHFGSDFNEFFGESLTCNDFWETTKRLIDRSPTHHIFSELHDYRSSSLGCVVIDTNDEEEPLKSYNLNHVLKHREGEIVSLDHIPQRFEQVHERKLTGDERAWLDQTRAYSVAGFLTTGTCDSPREYYIDDFRFTASMRDRVREGKVHEAIDTLPDPGIRTNPPLDGLEEIGFEDEEILVQFVPGNPRDVRERFGLGPYASIVPTAENETLLLGDDAIKGHSQLVAKSMRGLDQ